MNKPLEIVLAYHERTKHHFQRYAAGPGGLDWATQPEAFRIFSGSAQVALPLLGDAPQAPYVDLYRPHGMTTQPLTRANIAALLELSLGLSAWKQHGGTRWALRCNPSSGNLHPTEGYIVTQSCDGIADGVHHYLSRDHLLEQRCSLAEHSERLLPADSFLVGLSSIHWREAWKYGERAYRYCQHDAGHAIAAVRYAAATLGWQARLLSEWSDAAISSILGLEREADFAAAEREHPDAIVLVQRLSSSRDRTTISSDALCNAATSAKWSGHANVLSPRHAHHWPIIETVAQACAKPATQTVAWHPPTLPAPLHSSADTRAAEIIRQRRSAQAFDGVGSISATGFYRMLDMTLPRPHVPPWDALEWAPRVHLALFVHRVEGLVPGVYLFLRNEHVEARMRAELSDEFEWVRAENSPEHFKLYRVVAADARNAAKALSCHQAIAADGAFSLGMLAEYESALAQGPWVYRHLFWETGILGHVLYLEAEAAGVRGTGIGCFFDNAVHDLLGIKGRWLQSLYHFTVGNALTDTRLQTLPPYAHLERR